MSSIDCLKLSLKSQCYVSQLFDELPHRDNISSEKCAWIYEL